MTPYARTRSEDHAALERALVAQLFLVPDATLLAFSRQALRAARRREWRDHMAWRSASLSRILRLIERELGSQYAGRAKKNGTWSLFAAVGAEVVEAARVRLPPLRRRDDFAKPVEVSVLRTDIVCLKHLQSVLLPEARHD